MDKNQLKKIKAKFVKRFGDGRVGRIEGAGQDEFVTLSSIVSSATSTPARVRQYGGKAGEPAIMANWSPTITPAAATRPNHPEFPQTFEGVCVLYKRGPRIVARRA